MNNLQSSAQVSQPRPPASNLKIWQMIAFMALGSLLTIGLALVWLALFIGSPATLTSLASPPLSGKADVTARVSQEYVNREVAFLLKDKPISILAVGEVSQAIVQFNPDSTLNVTARIKALGRQIDFNVKDKVFLKDNKLALALLEDPKLEGLGIPLGVLKGIIEQVNNTVSAQLNGLVQSVGAARDCTSGKAVGRVPTLQALNLEQGVLVAEFSIAINA